MYLGYTSGCNSNEVGTTEKFRPGWQNSEISTAPAERQDTNVEHGRNDAIGLGLRSREYLSIYMCVQPLERLKQSLFTYFIPELVFIHAVDGLHFYDLPLTIRRQNSLRTNS